MGKLKFKKYQKRGRGCNISAVNAVSKAVTKKGKIKGRNKKETKILKLTCCHHFYDRKEGETVTPIFSNSDGTRVCEMCGKTFSSHFYSNSELKNTIEPTKELLNQLKFMAVAIGADNATVDTIVKTYVGISSVSKLYKRCRKVAASTSKVKKNKKGKKKRTNQYGSWK